MNMKKIKKWTETNEKLYITSYKIRLNIKLSEMFMPGLTLRFRE